MYKHVTSGWRALSWIYPRISGWIQFKTTKVSCSKYFKSQNIYQIIHPPKLTCNLKIPPCNRINIYKPQIFGFHVSFRGCISDSHFLSLPLKKTKEKQLEVPVGFAEAHQGQLTEPETATGPSHQGSWALKLGYSWTHATFDGKNQRNVECQCSQCTCCITGAYHLRSLISSRLVLMSCLQSLGTTAFRLTSIDITGSDKTSDIPR